MEKVNRIRFTTEQKEKMLAKTKNKCAHCGKKLTLDAMTVEHMYPLNKGGDNSEYNTIALCEQCNNEKSNWVYDITYFPYINRDERGSYSYKLMESIYNNSNDTCIFGKCNRIIYRIPSGYERLMNNKKNENSRLAFLKMVSKKIEARQMYRGDLDKTTMTFIREYGLNEGVEINEYGLRNALDESTLYGYYYNNELLAIVGFININKLVIENTLFLDAISKLNCDKVFVNYIIAVKNSDISLKQTIMEWMLEYMAMTGNLILTTESFEAKDIVSMDTHDTPYTLYKLNSQSELFGNTLSTGISLGASFVCMMKWLVDFKKAIEGFRNEYEKHTNKEDIKE